jgi:hypothetical protein
MPEVSGFAAQAIDDAAGDRHLLGRELDFQ